MSETCQIMSKEEYQKLSMAEQRIIVAKDVIKYLDTELLVAKCGNYVHLKKFNGDYVPFDDLQLHIELDEYIKTQNVQCVVCAKGAFFIAYVMRNDNCKVYEYGAAGSQYKLAEKLPCFSREQMNLIECAFEGSPIYMEILENGVFFGEEYNQLVQRAVNFYNNYTTNNERLRAIANNIIENNGTFIP